MATATATQKGITCPDCDADTRVLNTEHDTDRTRRQRLCKGGAHFFVTKEIPVGESHEEPFEIEDPSGYPCTQCGHPSRVLQTRSGIGQVRRKRCCTNCSHIFKTKEYPRP